MPYAALLPSRALLRVSKDFDRPDHMAFLQGLVSSDVSGIEDDQIVYAALLTPQGKFLHDMFLVTAGIWILVDCEAARRDDLKQRLVRYRLRAKIEIVEDDRAIWALWGRGTLELTRLSGPEARGMMSFANGVVVADPRLPALGARAILDAGQPDAPAHSGFEIVDADAYDRWRLSHGVPDGSRDMEVEKALLLESNFEELNGVDFAKGCYVGQELTARTKFRGLIKKRLVPVAIDGEAPPPGTPVFAGETEAGTMRSSAGGLGLALLRLDALGADAPALRSGEARLVPRVPAWLRLEPAA